MAFADDFNRITLKNEKRFQESLMCYQSTYEYEQETRQVRLQEEYRTIVVHVAREDYPQTQATVTLNFLYSAAQGYWPIFLTEVRDRLQMDFIDSIYEKDDLAPIHTTLSLKNEGHYLIRQREESSVLELIHTGIRPGKIVWPITKYVNSSKQSLRELVANQTPMETRIDRLINRPQVRVRQRGITTLLLKAQYPVEVLKIINELVKEIDPTTAVSSEVLTDELKAELEADNLKKRDPELDLPSIYRLSLECLNRLAVKGMTEEVGDDSIVIYILDTLSSHRDNIDITVIGMKLLNDIVKALTRHVDQVFQVVMDTLQFYAPPPTKAYPRVIKRLLPSPEEVAQKKREEEERILIEQRLKEEQDLLELESKISAKGYEANQAALQNITTKVTIPKPKTVTLTKKQLKIQKQMRERRERADQFQSTGDSSTTPGHLPLTAGLGMANDQERKMKRSGRLPVAQVVNGAWNHTVTQTGSNFHLAHSGGDPALPRLSTWGGPRLSRRFALNNPLHSSLSFFRPLKSLAEPTPKRKSLWTSFLSSGGGLSFDIGGGTEANLDMLEDTSSLPPVSGIKFTGIGGNQKSQVAFLQCIMTIYQYIACHYANRESAYELYIHEELCDIGLLCVHLPRVMSYILWSLDKMMIDRIEEAENRVSVTPPTNKPFLTNFVTGAKSAGTEEERGDNS
jgi:hypothetical protein